MKVTPEEKLLLFTILEKFRVITGSTGFGEINISVMKSNLITSKVTVIEKHRDKDKADEIISAEEEIKFERK